MRETAYRLARAEKLPRYKQPRELFTVCFVRFEEGLHEYYRAVIPGLKLREYGLCNALLPDEGTPEELINNSDVVVISRPNQPSEVEAIKQLKRIGKSVIVDSDDYTQLMYKLSPRLAQIWSPERIEYMNECIRLADAVTVSVPTIAERYLEIGAKKAITLDNCLDPRSKRWDVKWPEDDGKIRITWVAGFTHAEDAKIIEEPIKAVLKKYPQAVFRSMGYLPEWVADLDYSQIEILPTAGVLDLPKAIAGADIALGPLEPNDFNEYRSVVKAWESTCAGAVFVASNYGPYARDLVHNSTAVLCNTPEDWVEGISSLVESQELREKIWWQAFKELMRRSIDSMVPAFYLTYKEALDDRRKRAVELGGQLIYV